MKSNILRQSMSPIRSAALYFGLTLLLTWIFWWLAVLIGEPYGTPMVTLLHALGGISPAVVAITLNYFSKDPEARRDYWRRVFDFRRIPLKGYMVIFLFALLTSLLAVGVEWFTKGYVLPFHQAASLLAQPFNMILFALGLLVFGPVPEELGWRGFALDKLQTGLKPLPASLIVAFFWCAWHIPLFFIPGTYQNQLGVGTCSFWLFLLALVPDSILMTWLYNLTNRSTLSAILFHFMTNFTGEFLALSQFAAVFRLIFSSLVALGIVLWWNTQRYRRT